MQCDRVSAHRGCSFIANAQPQNTAMDLTNTGIFASEKNAKGNAGTGKDGACAAGNDVDIALGSLAGKRVLLRCQTFDTERGARAHKTKARAV